jgi:hypothetical protein
MLPWRPKKGGNGKQKGIKEKTTTYWDKSVPMKERHAEARRQPLPEPEVQQHDTDGGSDLEDDDDNEPI